MPSLISDGHLHGFHLLISQARALKLQGNDANDWAIETMGNPRYPLELFLRVLTVSLDTMKIVNNLPKLDI
jgi:hypothetical protein